MYVTKRMRTETGHRLVDYDGRCAHLHGHSYLWEVTVRSHGDPVDYRGMVVDFKDLKDVMIKVLDPLDHCMILHGEKDPLVRLAQSNEILLTDILAPSNADVHRRVWLVPFNPTAENLAKWAFDEIQNHLPAPISVTRVRVWETADSWAQWGK